MKTLEFIYQENAIHFLVNPKNDNVMINATEMAKAFNKRIENFKVLEGTEKFIEALLRSENSKFEHCNPSEQLTEKDIIYGTNKATFMHRKLSIYFAFWLDVEFQIWIIDTIDEIIFGNYKKHWEAHAIQEQARLDMESLKIKLLQNPTLESVKEYFEAENSFKYAKNAKTQAIKNQLKMF
jgi:hypothetical protein